MIEPLQQQGKIVVLSLKRNSHTPRQSDKELYKARHLIENFFAQLKQYRTIATCYDKLVQTFLCAIYMMAAINLAQLITRLKVCTRQ